ncbi:MAG TPA: toast rack family protein [Candidatus Aquilonibacter sp.]|nr:toast rack family protein [Candidatus Aquilonibacter sp.]
MSRSYRRSSLGFALLLVAVGGLWLYANMHPGFDPWNLLFRYWPVILIAIGLGKLVDYFIDSHNDAKVNAAVAAAGGASTTAPPMRHSHTGEALAMVILIVLVIVALSHHGMRMEWRDSSRSVNAQGAQSADVNITIPAGDLTLRGGAGAGNILEADFHYATEDGEPNIEYSVSNHAGALNLTQENPSHLHLVTNHNDWSLRMNNNIASNLKIEIGAGHGDLDLHGMTLTGLDLEMGAGQVNADLDGNWKKDSSVTIQGGVGQATLRLPENIGVEVHASGGIGAISTDGLHKQGDAYVNDAYGKSPVTLYVNITGGVGQISLISEP